jgi:hypothetical protein
LSYTLICLWIWNCLQAVGSLYGLWGLDYYFREQQYVYPPNSHLLFMGFAAQAAICFYLLARLDLLLKSNSAWPILLIYLLGSLSILSFQPVYVVLSVITAALLRLSWLNASRKAHAEASSLIGVSR